MHLRYRIEISRGVDLREKEFLRMYANVFSIYSYSHICWHLSSTFKQYSPIYSF